MLDILRKFFRFCDERERKEFYISIGLGVAAAIFSAMKIPAIGVMLQAILNGAVTTKAILLSFVIMLVSVVGSSLLKYKARRMEDILLLQTREYRLLNICAIFLWDILIKTALVRLHLSLQTPWIISQEYLPVW